MPAATRYLRPDVIARIRRLDLKARFIVEGFISGLHGSPFHGFSVEFSEHRKYVPGDDLRLIDWAVFARTDRFYIRKFEAETNLACHLVVDTSASMAYPPRAEAERAGRLTKLDYTICLAASLGYLMIHQQDAVGLTRFDSDVRSFLPARSRRSQLMRIIGDLARVQPVRDHEGKGLPRALHEVARRVPHRGLVVVLSDFLTDPDEVIEALHHLRFRGHDLILFQVLDATESTFPFDHLSTFVDPETQRTLVAQPEAIRAGYLRALEAFIQTYRAETAALRADFVSVDTAMTFDRALIHFLLDRQRRF